MIGDEHSDTPVALPLEAIEVDAFRRAHHGDTFRCGVLLGGCGKQLTTKLYIDRACHFAHYPEPGCLPTVCRRASTGVSSADHLYIKQGMARWLARRGVDIAAQVPAGGTGTIVLSEPTTGAGWWIHLPSAARTHDRPADETPPMRTLLTEDHPAGAQLHKQGFVHRIRCEAAGTERLVKVGTQVGTAAGPMEWFDLADCSLTRDGLITPTLARHRNRKPTAKTGRRPEEPALEPEARELIKALRKACRQRNAGQAEELTDRAFQLCLQAEGATRTALRTAVTDAKAWLRSVDPADRQKAAFSELKRLTRTGTPQQLSASLHKVMQLTPKTRDLGERNTLHAARARLAELAQPAIETPTAVLLEAPPPSAFTDPDTPDQPPASQPEPANPGDDFPQPPPKPPAADGQTATKALGNDNEPNERPTQKRAPRPETAPQRTWLEPQTPRARERREALTALRARLTDLTTNGYDLDAEHLGAIVAELTRLTETAGTLPGYEAQAVRTWTRRLAELKHTLAEGPTTSNTTAPPTPARDSHDRLHTLARTVRSHLQQQARNRSTTTLSRLRNSGVALPHLDHAELPDLLALVDRDTPPDEPLLAGLLTTVTGQPHPLLPRVLERAGRTAPADGEDFRVPWAVDVLRLYQVWRHRSGE
ncbi:hypothetical protein [Kitasatospora sp. NPDC006786]|uniref:hypothetical protein n=1 Tax=unclassified Kitasatospora TaxID=2633591 RepID=UPI003409A6F2